MRILLLLNLFRIGSATLVTPRHMHAYWPMNDARRFFSSIVSIPQLPSWSQLVRYTNFHKHVHDVDADNEDVRRGVIVQKIEYATHVQTNVFSIAYDEDVMLIKDCHWGEGAKERERCFPFVLLLSWHASVHNNQSLVLLSDADQQTFSEAIELFE